MDQPCFKMYLAHLPIVGCFRSKLKAIFFIFTILGAVLFSITYKIPRYAFIRPEIEFFLNEFSFNFVLMLESFRGNIHLEQLNDRRGSQLEGHLLVSSSLLSIQSCRESHNLAGFVRFR